MPQTLGLLAYRNRRGVLLDLAGWDERRDAHHIQTGKRALEAEQRDVFTATVLRPSPAAAKSAEQEEVRTDE